jgi:hypothetical protein
MLCMHPFRKRPNAPKYILMLFSAFLIFGGAAFFSFIYDLYAKGLAPGIGRSASNVLIATNQTYSTASFIFHGLLSIFLIVFGLYLLRLAIKKLAS